MSLDLDLANMNAASQLLIRALDAQDADAILDAAQHLHRSTEKLAAIGAWHADAPRPYGDMAARLADIAMLIRAAEYRVRYLTDHVGTRVTALAQMHGITPATLLNSRRNPSILG
jgi:hypothetical protein